MQTKIAAIIPPKSPPIAPLIVLLGLIVGQSFLPFNKLPAKYAITSVAGVTAKASTKAENGAKWFTAITQNANPKLVQRETFPGAGHAMSYMVDTERYWKVATEFMQKVLA